MSARLVAIAAALLAASGSAAGTKSGKASTVVAASEAPQAAGPAKTETAKGETAKGERAKGEPAKSPAPKIAAAAPDPAAALGNVLAGRVQKTYAQAKDFSAKFAQSYSYAALGTTRQSTGHVMVKKPGLLRWEYETPEKKLLLLDGKTFWQYVPEDNQVIRTPNFRADELSAAFTFLWGKGDFTAEFSARAVPLPELLAKVPGAEKDALELLPKKPSASIQKVVFALDGKGTVRASLVVDGQGNENLLVFSEEKSDSGLSDALFKFEVPKGAAVQELR